MIPWLKGYNSHLGAIAIGVIGILSSTGMIDEKTMTAALAMAAAFFGVSIRKAIKKP